MLMVGTWFCLAIDVEDVVTDVWANIGTPEVPVCCCEYLLNRYVICRQVGVFYGVSPEATTSIAGYHRLEIGILVLYRTAAT
jgi:hypothetical protein